MRQTKKKSKTGYRIGLLGAFLLLAASTTAQAAGTTTITDVTDTSSQTVIGRYTPGKNSANGTVVSFDIIWGDLDFTYQEEGAGTWNPSTHRYEYDLNSTGWGVTNPGGNRIQVVNHSNTDIKMEIQFRPSSGHGDIGAKFTRANQSTSQEETMMQLDSAETTNAAVIGDWYMHLTGGRLEKSGQIGTITITEKSAY